MKNNLSPQGRLKRPPLKSHPHFLIGISILLIFTIPALACNLPQRQPELVFPTSQLVPSSSAATSVPGQPQSASQATLFPPSTGTPFSPTASELPEKSAFSFLGLATATPGRGQTAAWQTPDPAIPSLPFSYWTQPGDTLAAVSSRFGVTSDQISPAQPLTGLLLPGQQLTIPNVLGDAPYTSVALPDSAIVYSPAAAGFLIDEYVSQAGGFLSTYQEEVDKEKGEWLSGAQIVERVAIETSVNPKVLLAFLEYRAGWVRGQPFNPGQVDYPIGFYVPEYKGLYQELSLAAKQLNIGYYGWRDGSLTDLVFPNSAHVRMSPSLNAGSAGVQTLTSKFYNNQQDWLEALYGAQGFLATYNAMFGDPWQAAAAIEPIYPPDLAQPQLELPFAAGESWALTAGPHVAWNTGTPRGALDFSPIIPLTPCAPSPAWVTAAAPGLVVRTGRGVVALDLDGDGSEQTGWVLVYMHVAERDRIPLGTWVETDTPLGHPSCEGGIATGTNLHLARKYNGEWMAADGPVPMMLGGWVAHNGKLSYQGTLEKEGHIVSARSDGSEGSTITR